ncbi:MAG TPA: hypothetical protein VFC31_03810 [Candidatus Limnocylindria bacterium]|nr:hypothetical protein [Candidatus Limnocylindria bacterium]
MLRVVRITVLVGLALTLVACGDHVSSTTAPAAPAATVATRAPATLTPLPTASPNGPIALGSDPRVGTISGGFLSGWKYDGATGAIARDPDAAASGVAALSPSGRYALECRSVVADGLTGRTDLWLIDTRTGTERLLYSPPADPSEPAAQPNPNIPPYVFRRTERAGPWSPDERYLAVWQIPFVSASADADGRPLIVIDVSTGSFVELGYTLVRPPAWRAPHTLAYIAGTGREAWRDKTLRVWTPESGSRDLTAPDEGLAPSWGSDGRLWFVRGASGRYDVASYFAGRGVGDRSIQSIDPSTGTRGTLRRVPGYADEGVSQDGRLLLVLRRTLDAKGGTDVWLELWASRPDGSDAVALLRIRPLTGFGYYGSYPSLSSLRWER